MSIRQISVGLVLVAVAAADGNAQASLPDSVARRVDAVFAAYKPDAPGCAMGVYQNGRVAYAKGYGSANIEYGIPLTPRTPMITGSLSKQFTAAAIALLVEQGRISLDDDVHKYVPELADYGKKITINNLVHHTSGLRDFWSLVQAAGLRNDDGYAVSDILTLASRQKHLNFDPGAEYNYSNTGYVLMGVVVQRVTGKTLRQFAAEQIFTPLAMANSHFHDNHNEPIKGRAFAYSPLQDGRWAIDIWNNDIVGQGGVMTTIEDLQKWDENFYTGRVGGKGFLARQLERGKLNNGTLLSYAFGLQVGKYRGLDMVEHGGSTGGYRTDIARFPSMHTTVVTMCNFSTADAAGLAHRVADAVLGAKFTEPVPPTPNRAVAQQQAQAATVKLTDAEMSALVGRYHSDELDATYELSRSGTALVLRRPRTAPDTVRATDGQTIRSGGYTLRFDPAGNGKSPAFSLDVGRARGMVFTRVASAR